jgi:hypothetical protein
MSYIKYYDEEQKPKRIVLDSEIFWEIRMHDKCKKPHKKQWGKEEERVVGCGFYERSGHNI